MIKQFLPSFNLSTKLLIFLLMRELKQGRLRDIRDRLKSSHFFLSSLLWRWGEGGKPHMKIEKKCDFADQNTWYRLSKNTNLTFTWGKKRQFSLKMAQFLPIMGGFSENLAPIMGALLIIRRRWLSRHFKRKKTKLAKLNII